MEQASALAELRGLAGLLETGLLALDDAGVASEQPGLLERRAVGLDVDGVERAGHGETQGAGLAGEVVSSTDIGFPLGPERTVAILPTNVTAFGEGLEHRPAATTSRYVLDHGPARRWAFTAVALARSGA